MFNGREGGPGGGGEVGGGSVEVGVFRLERSSLGHQVRITGGWCHWIQRTP